MSVYAIVFFVWAAYCIYAAEYNDKRGRETLAAYWGFAGFVCMIFGTVEAIR